jgi:hypothetical protein
MDYKKHTQDRYLQRFGAILTDDDYSSMKLLVCKDNAYKKNRNVFKEIIKYKNQYIWCVFNRKNTIFTVYPVKKKRKKNETFTTMD